MVGQARTDHKRVGVPAEAILVGAGTLADLAKVDPRSVPQLCEALIQVLDRAPRVGWSKALDDAGFTRKAPSL